MLKLIQLYWIHNDASDKANLLNDYSKEPGIIGQRFAKHPIK